MEARSLAGSHSTLRLNLYLRAPVYRIFSWLAVRSWVFYRLYGKYQPFISVCKLSNILILGVPCDFSGELSKEIKSKVITPLIISGFNGQYIGYVTPDKYYQIDDYETRTMNWFGYGNGSYFLDIIEKIFYEISQRSK